MKTAVLISGQMRTFGDCIANLNWHVFRRLDNPTFFISCADDEQARDAYLIEGYSKNAHVERLIQPEVGEPPYVLARHAPYAPNPNNATVIQPILKQLWHYRRVWDFHRQMCPDEKFGIYVRCRPDLFFHRFDMPRSVIPYQFVGPWKATCGGVNDRFSIMGPVAAEAYFTAFDKLTTLLDAGCPLHPESIQQAALESAGCVISNTLRAEFTCKRLAGSGDDVPLVEYPGELARYIEAISHIPPPVSVWKDPVL